MLAYEGVLLTKTAAQEIPDTTETLVSFDTEIHDTNGYHSTVDPTEIIIPTSLGGTYWIYASIQWEKDATGTRWIQLVVNGTPIAEDTDAPTAGNVLTNYVGTTWELSEGDVVTLNVYQSSGGALDIERSAYTPRFGVDLMGV